MEKEFTGKVSQMKQASRFLASEDFIGLGEIKVIINGVFEHSEEKMHDGKIAAFYCVGFEKTKKRMVLNATNRKTLAACFGSDTAKWIGKEVEIYVEHGVKNPKGGEKVTGLRLKAKPDPELLKANRNAMTGGDQ